MAESKTKENDDTVDKFLVEIENPEHIHHGVP